MAPSTPSTPESGPAKKPAARKTPVRKAAAKPTTADALAAPAAEQPAVASAAPEATATVAPDSSPVPETANADAAAAEQEAARDTERRGSILDGVRANPMGPAAVGLVVAIGIGLLLSVLVPSDPNTLALVILGTLLSAAVGFSMRYLSVLRNVARQFEALVITVIGVHVMSVTGALNMDLPFLSDFGVSGPGFNESLLAALATPPVSTGGLVAGIVAAIIVGWGRGNTRAESVAY